jgi:hypothetical protein
MLAVQHDAVSLELTADIYKRFSSGGESVNSILEKTVISMPKKQFSIMPCQP